MNPVFKAVYQHDLLTDAALQSIADLHQPIGITKGTVLLKHGETANEYYLLEKGLVRAFVYDYEGNEITTEFFTENDIVIVPASLFQRLPSKENLQALTDALLWKISFDDFQLLFHHVHGFTEWGRLWFTSQLFAVKQRYLDTVTDTATSRYLKLMQQRPQIIQFAPLKNIASYLGVTDTSLSRIRKEITG